MQSDLERKVFELLTHSYPAPFARVHWLAKQIADLVTQEPTALSDKQAAEVNAPEDWELVPKSAIMWLIGAGPDSYGNWFEKPEGAPAFWWRTHFNKLRADAAKLRSALVDVPAVEPVGDDLIGYVLRYGGMCRDCADMDGVCQSGQPCDTEQRRAVVKHTISALAYGIKHGFIASPFHAPPLREGEDSAEVIATHRHKKRGSEYVLLGFGKMQAEACHEHGWDDVYLTPTDKGIVDMREVAIYRSIDDGSLWVRPREEFEDGRFESLAATRSGSATTAKGRGE